MFVHITVSKLYFGWSHPHLLSQLSIELAHSSSSVLHCPFSLHSLSCCVLKPIPTPLSSSPSAGRLLTSPVSRGRMSPASSTPAPHSRKFLYPFRFFWSSEEPHFPRWTIYDFYHPSASVNHSQFEQCLLCILDIRLWLLKRKISFLTQGLLWYSLDSGENWLKWFFLFSFETKKPFLFAYGIKTASFLKSPAYRKAWS